MCGELKANFTIMDNDYNMLFKSVISYDFKMNNNNMWNRKLDTAEYSER